MRNFLLDLKLYLSLWIIDVKYAYITYRKYRKDGCSFREIRSK